MGRARLAVLLGVIAAMVLWLLLAEGGGARRDTAPVDDAPAGASPTATAAPAPPPTPAPVPAPPADAGLAAAKPAEPAAIDPNLPPPVDLEKADRDLDLFGVVVTKDGAPVADADLRAVTYPTRRANLLDIATRDVSVEAATTKSAIDGTFAMRLRRGEHVALRVAAKGFGRLERPGCTAGQRLRIVLAPGVILVTVLKDEAGNAVAETEVRLFRPEHAGEAAFERRERSDASGRATFADLPGGVWAWIDPVPVRLGKIGWKKVDLPAQGETVVDVVLPKGRTITGRVVEAATNTPIAGARVGSNWVQDRAVTTGADGRYEYSGWNDRQGSNDLHATAEGYGRRGIEVGSKDVVDFALERGDSVVGRAVDDAGKPVGEVLVSVVAIGRKAGSTDGDILGSTSTAADGRFRMTSLRRDQEHSVVLMARGFGRTLLDFPPRAGAVGEVDVGDVRLPRARAIEGRVRTADGKPIADATVSLRGANSDRRRLLGDAPDTGDSWYGQTEEARTDDVGRFRFPDLAPGSYVVKSSAGGRPQVSRAVLLAAEQDVLDADLVFEEGRDVTIVVLDPAGAPLAGAYVRVSEIPYRGEPIGGQSNAKGEVRVTLPRGEWALDVHWIHDLDSAGRNFLSVSGRRLPPEGSRIEVRLEESGVVAGRLVAADGAGVGGLTVEALRGTAKAGTGWSEPDGKFTVEVAKGSPVVLRAQGVVRIKGAQPQAWTGERTDVAVGATDVSIAVVRLQQDRTVTIRALGPDGRPVVGAPVNLSSPSGLHRNLRTNEQGARAVFSDLTPERWSGRVLPAGHMAEWAPAEVEVADPAGFEVEARFRVGLAVAGVVLDAEGKPASGAFVGPLIGDSAQMMSPTDSAGRFRFAVDPEVARPLRVSVSAPGRSPETFDVPSVPAEGLTFRLKAPSAR